MRELNRTIRLLEQWANALDVVVCPGFGGPLRREAERLRRIIGADDNTTTRGKAA